MSGREYRVYFYSTYINQFSKIKNDPKDEKNSNNNNGNALEKRKRIEQAKNKEATEQEKANGDKTDDLESGTKKRKSFV